MSLCTGPWEQGLTQSRRRASVRVHSSHRYITFLHSFTIIIRRVPVGGPSPPPWSLLLLHTMACGGLQPKACPQPARRAWRRVRDTLAPCESSSLGARECPGELQGG